MKQIAITYVIVIAIVVGALGFYGGMQYQRLNRTGGANRGQFGMMGGFGRGANGGMRPIAGQITSADASSITVKLQDGSSKIVLLSSQTRVVKTNQAATSDLKTGQTVAVFGAPNQDGSITAQNIQLNPQTRGMMQQASPSGSQQK